MGNSRLPAVRSRGRPPAPTTARDDILTAARAVFAERGYAGTSLREVARRSGVDPALVRHYFGDKEGLFTSAMRLPINPGDIAASVFIGEPAELGTRLARFFLTTWEPPEARTVITGFLGAALTHRGSAELLREAVQRFVVGPLASLLPGQDAALRAELAGSHLVGIAVARYAVGIEPLASAPLDRLVAAVGPALQRYLLPEAA